MSKNIDTAAKSEIKLPEKNCPKCAGTILWKIVIGGFGAPIYNGHCPKCAIVFKNREVSEVTEGKELAKELIGTDCMDEKITQHSTNTQIGILRAMQHCSSCRKPSYSIGGPKVFEIRPENDCQCTNCKCVFCTIRKSEVGE